jgi:GT2 family glycosyltransferase
VTRVSFIVLCYNSARVIERCVRSLAAEGMGQDEIWIVDNGSSDGSREVIASLQDAFPDTIRTVHLEHNVGTTVSRNQALRQASGKYIGIVDSDVEVLPGTVVRLLASLEGGPRRGLVAPRLLYRDGRLQLSTDRFPTITHKLRRYLSLRRMEHRLNAAPPPPAVGEVDYAIAAFWLMKRDVVERVGLLDERIFYAPEDVDYCLRIWQSGYTCVYDSTVHAIHDAQEISRVAPWRRTAISHLQGLLYLFAKHRYFFGTRRLRQSIASAHRTAP